MDYFKEINAMKAEQHEEVKGYILRLCAHNLIPLERYTISKACQAKGWTKKLAGQLLDELVEDARLVPMGSSPSNQQYRLPWLHYSHYFQPLSPKEYKEFSRYVESSSYSYSGLEAARNLLYNWGRGDRTLSTQLYRSFPSDANFVTTFCFILCTKKWFILLNHLPSEYTAFVLHHLAFITEKLGQAAQQEVARTVQAIAKSKKLLSHARSLVEPISYWLSMLLRKGLIGADAIELCEHSVYSYYIKALSLQYQGETTKAITHYVRGRSMEKKLYHSYTYVDIPHESPRSSFFALMYHIALSSDAKKSSENRIKKILTYYSERLDLEHPASRLLLYHSYDQKKELKQYQDALISHADYLSELDFVLMVMVSQHYQLTELPDSKVARAVELMEQHAWALLQLEASTGIAALHDQQDKLAQQLQLSPLLQKVVKVEAWQRHLNSINQLVETQVVRRPDSKQGATLVQQSRFIYHVDKRLELTPILQKSKNGGISWTKGRTVSMARFMEEEIEGMTATDIAVARSFTQSRTWMTLTLSNAESFAALVDHPHIYLESNPDISVQVQKDSPYLEVKKTARGFKIASNVPLESADTLLVKRESDVLIKVFELTPIQRDILKLFSEQSSYPRDAQTQLTELINSIANLIPVHSDLIAQNENIRQEKGSARITVQILPMAEGVKVELFAKPREEHPPYFKAGAGTETCLVTDDKGQLAVKRQLKAEQRNVTKVRKILRDVAKDKSIEDVHFYDELYDCLELLEQLQGMGDILRIEWPKGSQLKIRGNVGFGQMRLSARGRGEWFKIDGEVEVDEELRLSFAELLQRSRAHQGRFVELEQGEFLALSDELRKKLAELDNTLTPDKKGELQISQYRSSLLSDLEQGGATISADKQYKDLQQRVQKAYRLNIDIPSTLTATLRDYQVEGYEWLSRLAAWGAGACLADDMGLGKSVQSIAVLLDRAKKGASLIVAPASIMHNWRNEIARFAPSLRCHLLHESIEQREDIIQQAGKHDIVITTYGLLPRIGELLHARTWNVLLLDEAHNIKNRDTKSSKIAMELQGDFRIALTGTPVQNHLGEIWNLFNFTNPGLLGSFDQFNERYISPIEKDKDRAKQQQLKRMLQPFLLRRTKSEVLDELPSKTEIVHYVELSAAERAIYENIRQHAISSIEHGELNPIQTLAEITKLRQAACHPRLIDESFSLPSSAKLDSLMEIVGELIENKHRALVFSQFTSFLAQAKKLLDTLKIPYLYLDGQTPIKQRAQLVEEYQQGDAPLFLISLKAGGTGLNLTAADYVIHLDPWWNPAIEDQASDRSHRMGQTRPVTIYKIIASQTIEERILEMHRNKKSLSDSLLEGGDMSTKLTKKDILNMLQDSYL